MTLTPGTRLGVYEVTMPIGEGGMGQVFRARDTKLDRDVAIKILPEAFAHDADRLARFTREAKTLASLNHPHIAGIYGLEENNGVSALVMELVEGDDLSQRISRGAIPLDEALPIAKQIAEALEAAHEQGIIHRDLKPANIKVRGDGAVKVLDFGLAKAIEAGVDGQAGGVGLSMSPTIMSPAQMSGVGVILGTAAYMAPEQARGKAVDKRADIWAFGCVVFEMLTGRRAFGGDEISDVLAAVLRQDIDWSALPAATPSRLRRLLERCLDRDARQRLRDIGEARVEIARIEAGAHDVAPAMATTALQPKLSGSWLWWFALPVAAIAAAVTSWTAKPQIPIPAAHLSIALPAGEQVTAPPAVSPDGKTIAYVAGRARETSRLYLRAIDSFSARAVDSSRGALWPFFSPDGGSIAFFASGKLWRASVAGGAATAIAAAPRPWGGSWGGSSIVYVPNLNAGLWSVPETGGTPIQLTKPDGASNGYAHANPQGLPGTDDVLFSFWGQTFYVALFSRKAGTWREVTPPKDALTRPSGFVYAANGYVLVGDGTGGLKAVEWNPSVSTARSAETAVIDNVYWIEGNERPFFSIAANGTVAYAPGSPNKHHLVWVDRRGGIVPLPGDADSIDEATLSRGGTRIVRHGRLSQWVEDLNTGTRTRIVSDLLTYHGGWLPGDDRIVVSSNKDGDWDLYSVSANGNGEMKPLLKKPFTQHPMAVAPDGSVVYFESHPVTGSDLWVLMPDGRTRPLVVTQFNESAAAVSSDGKYVAYVSDESGHNEVYAIPFSGTGNRVTISTDGGTGPVWSRDGRELFYRAGDDLMSVEVRSTSPLVLGTRKKLLDVSAFEPGYFHDFDVSADGQRFLFIRAEPDARPTRIDVMTNWFPELLRLIKR